MNIHISIDEVWEKLSDHYYDNVHYSDKSPKSLRRWIERDYGGRVDMDQRKIYFDTQSKRNWFALRWL